MTTITDLSIGKMLPSAYKLCHSDIGAAKYNIGRTKYPYYLYELIARESAYRINIHMAGKCIF